MKFEVGKSKLVVGVLAIIGAVLLEIIILAAVPDDRSRIIGSIIAFVFFESVALAGGVLKIREYFRDLRCMNNALNKFGKENIIKQIENSTVLIYKYLLSGRKMYFTDKLVVDPKIAIFSYNDISLMYSRITQGNVKLLYITFELFDGNKFSLCDGADQKKIDEIMELCFRHNPKILVGESKENVLQHKTNVKKYKEGNIIVPPVRLDKEPENKPITNTEVPLPYILTPKGKECSRAQYFIGMGTILIIASLIFSIILPIVCVSSIDKEVNTISKKERNKLLSMDYEEYRTKGWYLERESYIEPDVEFYNAKDIYIYELEDEKNLYLGVVGDDYVEYNSTDCDGFGVFYDGEGVRETITTTDRTYEVVVIRESDIERIYGIPSEETQLERIAAVITVIFSQLFMGGFGLILLIIGKTKMKKYKNGGK